MIRFTFGVMALALFLGCTGQVNADLAPPGSTGDVLVGTGPVGTDPQYNFTFSNISAGDAGYGTLWAVPSGLGDGSMWAMSGSFTLTSSSNGTGLGTYVLLSFGPGISVSPSTLFGVDNLIYPANDAASGAHNSGSPFGAIISNPSYLTNYGLLFGPGSGTTGSQSEINIWGNGGGDYAFGSEKNGIYNIQDYSGGTFTFSVAIASVPEPSSLTVVLGIGALVLGVYSWRRRVPIAQALVPEKLGSLRRHVAR